MVGAILAHWPGVRRAYRASNLSSSGSRQSGERHMAMSSSR
jgi:hypothetical protein